MDNFIYQFKIPEKLCDKLIEYFNNNTEYKHEGTNSDKEIDKSIKDSIDVSVFPSSNNKNIQSYLLEMERGVREYFEVYSFPKINRIGLTLFTKEGFNLQLFAVGVGY